MKPIRTLSLLFFMVISLSSCSLFNGILTNDKMMNIQKGMTKSEVQRLLGAPDYRNFDREWEEWVYITPTKNLIIGFYNDLVETMNTYPLGTYSNRSTYPKYDNYLSTSSPPISVPAYYDSSKREREFQQLYNAVQSEPFKDKQLQLLRNGVYNRFFTVDQSVRMMSIYTFDDDKLKVLEIMAPKIVDRENQFKIFKALSFISSRDKAEAIMNVTPR